MEQHHIAMLIEHTFQDFHAEEVVLDAGDCVLVKRGDFVLVYGDLFVFGFYGDAEFEEEVLGFVEDLEDFVV